jgi:cystathionine gamma-synthase/methionine-gamma-lyase
MTTEKTWRLETQAVHAGRPEVCPDFIPTVVPIQPSVTYRYPSMETLDEVFAGTRDGYVYARYGNPTVTALEKAVAALEGCGRALAFGSGMAAIHAALLALGARAGSAVVAAQDIYGATYTLLDGLLSTQDVTVTFVETSDLRSVETACADLEPVAVLLETVSNPLLKVADLPALAAVAHRHSAALVVDSTFATPYLVQPLTLGADVVIHSATKYLAGHGDVLGGIIITSDEQRQACLEVLKTTGANLSPIDAWMALRGIRTLALRMRQHCESALQVARWLEARPEVSRVLYPGLPSHPQHELANRMFRGRGYGGMVAFELAGAGQREVFRFFESLRLCQPASTLGNVHTVLLYPAHSSHRGLTAAERARLGIDEGLVRLSVGIEAVEDLLEDLDQALASLS